MRVIEQAATRFAAVVSAVGAMAVCVTAQPINNRGDLNTLLGANQTLEDFESFDIANGNAVNLDVFMLDSNTIANGQGPGLVEAGATYVDPSSVQLQWNGNAYFGLNTKTLLSNGSGGAFEITYGPTVQAMGIDLRAFEGFPYQGVVQVYAGASLVYTTNFALTTGGAENVFFGYRHDPGISRVLISSGTFSWSPIVDNHGYGNIPEPLSAVALAAGLLGLAVRRRRA